MATQLTHTVQVNDKGRTIITLGDYQLLLVPRGRNGNPREMWAKSRLYGAMDTLGGEHLTAIEDNAARPVSGPGLDDFQSDAERQAHMKEYRALRTRATRHVKAQLTDIFTVFAGVVFELSNLTAEGIKFSISAGCTTCPCSPGFILANTVTYLGLPVDLWLEPVARD